MQIPLRIGLRDSATFDNFLPGENRQALATLRRGDEPFVYLWGGEGSGKSHLLQAACHQVSQGGGQALYLSLRDQAQLAPPMLEGLEQMALLALDDLEHIAAHSGWETALFHLYNRCRDSGCRLVAAASQTPANLGVALPDLVSRLSWGPVFQLHVLSDDDKAEALRRRAALRGMSLTAEVADYLLRHAPRGMGGLFELLERLDEASLAEQRQLTIPFVRKFIRR
jgi:DnaA family protein